MSRRAVSSGIDGASRTSSVFGLKVRPKTATVLPRSTPANEIETFRAMARKVSISFAGVLRGKTVAVLGLTFKPNTDDVREAPSIPLITALQDMGAKVRVYDPAGMEQARQVLADVTYCRGPYDCVEDADAAVLVTEWEQFRALDMERLRDLMACPVVVDLRNIYRAEDMKKHRFAYASVGRTSTHQPIGIYTPLAQAESLTPALSGAGTTPPYTFV